jgi:hypothetical protein
MASIITATTTSGLTQSADNSGVLQLASGTGNLVTVPSVTGTAMVSGNMPAFSAYNNASQALSNNTHTKIQCNIEEFDTASAYDNSTNYRFTPLVAGYYQVNAASGVTGSTTTGYVQASIYKNGSVFKAGFGTYDSITGTGGATVATVIYMNGSTDYVEFYVRQNTGAAQNIVQNYGNYFSAVLVRV